MKREIDRWIGAGFAVMRMLKRSVVVKTKGKLSRDEEASRGHPNSHELFVVTERMRLQIQAAEIASFTAWLGSVIQ